ncbi:hypothetical protein N9H96_02460 [Porticoccaceae bacterium]|nr:hypothetical protein [Porticoccaceae bacterium]
MIDMLKRRLPNNRLFLITLLVLVPIKPFAQDIVLRCDGELSQIWIPSRLDEGVLIDTLFHESSLPKSLSRDSRLKRSTTERIIRISPGFAIDTNAFGSAGAPGDIDMYLNYCKEENGALYCQKDNARVDGMFWDYFRISVIPPWSIFISKVSFSPKRADGKIIKKDSFMVTNSYDYNRFSSMNCEQINPIPALSEILR